MAEWRGAELTDALQRLGIPAYIADRDGVFTWMNAAARSHFGEVVGKHYSVIVAPEDLPRVREQFARKLLGGEATEYPALLLDSAGRRLLVEVSSVPVESGGRCEGVFGLAIVGPPAPEKRPRVRVLTARQSQVLELLAAGSSTDQMAEALTLSRETVRNHVRHVLRALGAHSRLEAVAIARGAGLLRGG